MKLPQALIDRKEYWKEYYLKNKEYWQEYYLKNREQIANLNKGAR